MPYTTYKEEDLLPLSALQHIVFCKRQCALIHVEQLWSENLFTTEGRIMHEKADSNKFESRGNVRALVEEFKLRNIFLNGKKKLS